MRTGRPPLRDYVTIPLTHSFRKECTVDLIYGFQQIRALLCGLV